MKTFFKYSDVRDYPAKQITEYMEIYIKYIQENSLDNDSDSISTGDLIDFVEYWGLVNLE